MSLETRKGNLLDDCDDSAVMHLPPMPRHLEPWLGARSRP